MFYILKESATFSAAPFYDLAIDKGHTGQACWSPVFIQYVAGGAVCVLLGRQQQQEITCCEWTVTNECDSDVFLNFGINSPSESKRI